MNQEEKICQTYQKEVRCFPQSEIPSRFEFNGSIDQKSCSFIFPPGYSIYVEKFILEDIGPDNFVLVDGESLEYLPKLKWTDRGQNLWTKLEEKKHPLKGKSIRRYNIPCVKTLKVS